MAVTEINARDFEFHLNTGTSASPTWVEVLGLDTWSHKPKAERTDRTNFKDAGRPRHKVNSRVDTITLKAKLLLDTTNGDRDAGQAAVAVWARAVSDDSVKQFRITWPDDATWVFDGTCDLAIGGGGNDDVTAWEATIEVSGDITETLT